MSIFTNTSIRVFLCLVLWGSLLAGVFAFSETLSPASAQLGNYAEYEVVDCAEIPIMEGIPGIECGFLYVPEDRDNPDSPEVGIAVVIIYSTSPNPLPDPVLYLEGGPGGSGLFAIEDWIESPILQERDIVLFDQRGTGFSEPHLGCFDETDIEDELEFAEACFQRLEAEGIDVSQYNSADSATDVEDLRLQLGYDQWNLFGISYGTRLALTVMRDYPDSVRSAILDSVYPPEIRAYEEQAVTFTEAILYLLDVCEADPACQVNYPDLDETLFDLIDSLNDDPLVYETEDEDGAFYTEEFYGDDLVSLLGDSLYDHTLIPYLPAVIDGLASGDDELFYALLNGELGGDSQRAAVIDEETWDEWYVYSDSDGLFNAVECYEEVPFNDLDLAYELIEPYVDQLEDAFISDTETMFDTCLYWAVEAGPPLEAAPVQSNIPTLLLTGSFDPVTPVRWAESAASYLPNSFLLEFPTMGHSVISGGDCPYEIVLSFLDEPTTPPEGGCIADMRLDLE
jgi:pimeloyl-ACP methyl ester carboxylesterase